MVSPYHPSRIFGDDLVHNVPVLSLIAANLVTIVLAVWENWDLATVMFIYWVQSLIIGLFTIATIFAIDAPAAAPGRGPYPRKSSDPHTITITNPWAAKGLLAGFFALHYGVFHWVYYTFIVDSGIFGTVHFSDPALWFSCGLFFVNHLCSFLVYYRHRSQEVPDLYGLITGPYQRIIPMHLTIIFGGMLLLVLEFFGIQTLLPVLVLFLLLKTYTDIAAHTGRHSGLQKVPEAPAGSP